jgi:hypothetical protein
VIGIAVVALVGIGIAVVYIVFAAAVIVVGIGVVGLSGVVKSNFQPKCFQVSFFLVYVTNSEHILSI